MSDVILLTSTVEVESHTPGLRTINLSGEPYAAAMVNIVAANYARLTGHEPPTEDSLTEKIGEKVTLIVRGENMLGAGSIAAREGRLFPSTTGALGILPKGKRSKGYRVDPSKVLDVLPGWVAADAGELVNGVVRHYPTLTNLTQERLEQLPRSSEMCSLALMGANRVFDAPDCVWLIGEYWPTDDICDTNVLLIRPQFGTSEHGSCYGRELLVNRSLGVIENFDPIPFGDAIKLCFIDFDEAVEQVLARSGRMPSYA